MMDPDLRDLLSVWLGKDLDAARGAELLVRLREDEVFRQAFIDEIDMLGRLKAAQSAEPRWLRLEDELGWGTTKQAMRATHENGVAQQRDDSPRPRPPRRRSWGRAMAAALLLLAAGSAIWFWPSGPRTAPATANRPFPKVDALTGLAMVLKLDGVGWEQTDEPHPSEGDLLPAGRYRFGSGRATLSMLTGVLLFVEGPADVELLSADKVLCRQGRLRARVPAGAEGFQVSGPSSVLVDLGTEFGVNVEADGKMQGRIFEGKLEAALLSATGIPLRSYSLNSTKANATKAVEINPQDGHITAIAASEDFISSSVLTAPALTLEAGYPAAILRSRPWGYWRFESLADGAIPNEIPERPPLHATGPIRLAGPPDQNRCVEFRTNQDPQFLTLQGLWHPTWRPGYAVELWCLSEAISHTTLASMVTPADTDHHVFLMELTSRNRLTLHKPASVRFLHRWPPGWEGGDNAYSQDPYVPYRWHHVVSQINGDRMELFVDGKPTSPLSISSEHSELPCQFILGRLTTQPGSGISIDRPFVGRMDEVALYERPLTVEEIREHHRLGAGQFRQR